MLFIQTPEKQQIAINEQSASQLAKHEALIGRIGKTSILELVRGNKQTINGFSIVDKEPPKMANKVGVEYVGKNTKRQRRPMKIYVNPCQGRGISKKAEGSDLERFMLKVYHGKAKGENVEYSAIAQALGWSRNMVAIYANRCRVLGLVSLTRQSNMIHPAK